MRQWVVLIGVVAVTGALLVLAPIEVGVAEVAVVARGNRVVDVLQPGLRWRWPLIDKVAYINLYSQRRVAVEVGAKLSDGTPCPVAAQITYAVADPQRAYQWRAANKRDLGRASSGHGHSDYEAPRKAFAEALTRFAAQTTVEDAAAGGLHRWIESFASETLADGTRVHSASATSVHCGPAGDASGQPKPAEPKPVEAMYGPLRPFAQKPSQVSPPGKELHSVIIDGSEVVMRDGTLARIEGLEIVFAIGDPARFAQAMGTGPQAVRRAQDRLRSVVEVALRETFGGLAAADLEAFDPTSIVRPGSERLKAAANALAVDVIGTGGAGAGYRLTTAGP